MALSGEAAGGERPPSRAEFTAANEAINRGPELVRTGEYAEAVAIFNKAPDYLHTNTRFLLDFGVSLTRVGGKRNVNRAIGLLEHATEIDEQNEQRNPWLHVGLAEAYGRAGRFEDAKTHWERANAIDPHNAEATFIRAEDKGHEADNLYRAGMHALYEATDYLGALSYYEKALVLKGQDGVILHDRGVALLRAGHPIEAADALEDAVALIPDRPFAHANLADAYRAASDQARTRAREEYQATLDLEPEHPGAKQGLENLQ